MKVLGTLNLELCRPEIEDAKARYSDEKGKGHAKDEESDLQGVLSDWTEQGQGQGQVVSVSDWNGQSRATFEEASCLGVGRQCTPATVSVSHPATHSTKIWRTGWISRELRPCVV